MTDTIESNIGWPLGSGDAISVTLNVTAYPSGGMDISPARLGGRLAEYTSVFASCETAFMVPRWTKSTNKLLLMIQGTGNSPFVEAIAGTPVGLVHIEGRGYTYRGSV